MYNTRQKENLLKFLRENSSEHITVQKICNFMSNAGTPVGTATVYRQLDKLVEQGTVRKYLLDGRSGACYQYTGNDSECCEHYHLKCIICGKLIHLDCEFLNNINSHILEHHGFVVDNSKTVFYGQCSECLKGDKNHK
ncbi:MAG: Fur family transcriptional regulator [Oscillospiraceae bacterium]|nr:Fur family transcriptional regulator [Oscillospiraceae bacterium]